MTLTKRKHHSAMRRAGKKGGSLSAQRKLEQKRRYLAGEMGEPERVAYEAEVERAREAGRRGGWHAHKARSVGEEETP